MPPSNPPPDRFQREIDDIIRLAERRLEHQSFSYRMRKSSRRLGARLGGFSVRLPSAETMGAIGMALLLAAMVISIFGFGPVRVMQPYIAGIGLLFLVLAILASVFRGRGGGGAGVGGGGTKMWRGEQISYGSPYGEGFLSRLRRMLRGR
jgi:hypothetical protein